MDELNRDIIEQRISQLISDEDKRMENARISIRKSGWKTQLARKFETSMKLAESSNEQSRESGFHEEEIILPDDIPHVWIPRPLTPAPLPTSQWKGLPESIPPMTSPDQMMMATQFQQYPAVPPRPRAADHQSPPMNSSYSYECDKEFQSLRTCQSCFQQIHRNAPICPMCKSLIRL